MLSKKKVTLDPHLILPSLTFIPYLTTHDSIEKDKNFDEDDNDIMSHLNYRKLEEIKKDFMKNEEQGLSIQQFIKVMLHHLPETKDKTGLCKNLIELFRQIDVNND